MRTDRGDGLFQGISFPNWDLDRFYELFISIRDGRANKFDQDQFARMLMYQVSIVARERGWIRSLNQRRIEPSDATAAVLLKLWGKRQRITLRHPCPKVLIKIVRLTIERELIGVLRHNDRKSKTPTVQGPEGFDRRATAATPDTRFIARAIADAEGRICGGSETLQIVWRFLLNSLMTIGDLPNFAESIVALGGIISADVHAYCSYFIRKTAAQAAEDVGAFAA